MATILAAILDYVTDPIVTELIKTLKFFIKLPHSLAVIWNHFMAPTSTVLTGFDCTRMYHKYTIEPR